MPTPTQPVRITPALQHRFHLLDALRGVAAVLIATFHAEFLIGHLLPAPNAFLAVDLFFVLSGFVIALSYERRLQSGLSFFAFTAARVIRLWPVYLLAAIIGFVRMAFFFHLHLTPLALIELAFLGLFMLPDFTGHLGTIFPLDTPSWSLFFEMFINLAYAGLILRRLASTRILLLLAAFSIAALALFSWHSPSFDAGYTAQSFLGGFPRVSFSFLVGVLLYRLYKVQQHPTFRGLTALAATLLLFVATFLALATPLTSSEYAKFLAVIFVFPAIVYLGACTALPRSLERPAAFLGNISYPLYLIHIQVLFILKLHSVKRFIATHPGERYAVLTGFLILSTTIAWLINLIYDTPIRRKLAAAYNVRFGPVLIKAA